MINFMTDDAGRKTHVVIPIDEFARMTDALEDVVDIKEIPHRGRCAVAQQTGA